MKYDVKPSLAVLIEECPNVVKAAERFFALAPHPLFDKENYQKVFLEFWLSSEGSTFLSFLESFTQWLNNFFAGEDTIKIIRDKDYTKGVVLLNGEVVCTWYDTEGTLSAIQGIKIALHPVLIKEQFYSAAIVYLESQTSSSNFRPTLLYSDENANQ